MLKEIMSNELFIYIIIGINFLLLILYIINVLQLKKLNTSYKKFIRKLGNGNNIEEILRQYVNKVDMIEKDNNKIMKYCDELNEKNALCIKKIGFIRFNAFKDTGSNLSFALALLNDNNDGVILNGLYSREMSNIYAKQIKNGKCISKLSEEENKALENAINS